MKVLILLKNDARDAATLSYASQLLKDVDHEIHLLNIISVPDEVPTKRNGQVLADCTEFDLSGYHKESSQNMLYLLSLKAPKVVIRKSLVGKRITIAENYAENEKMDLVISGSRITTKMEDLFSHSFSTRLLSRLKVPYLILKNEGTTSRIQVIGLVREFRNPKIENLSLLNELVNLHEAEIWLIKIKNDPAGMTDAEILAGMEKFRVLNKIPFALNKILQNRDKEAALKELVDAHKIDILALGSLADEDYFHFVGQGVRAQIVNHINAPIYTY